VIFRHPSSIADGQTADLNANLLTAETTARRVSITKRDGNDPYPFPAVSHEPRIQQLADDLTRAGHAKIKIIQAKCLLIFLRIRFLGDRQHSLAVVIHIIPAHLTGAVGESVRVFVIRRHEEEPCGVGRSGGNDHDAGSEDFGFSVAIHHDLVHRVADGVGVEFQHLGIREERDIRVLERGTHTQNLGIRLRLDFEFPMGNIQMVGKSQGPMYKGEKPIEAGLAPEFTLDFVAKHAVDFWLSTEDLPSPDNRVTIDREGNITLSYTPNNQVAKQRLYDKLKSMLNHLNHLNHLGMHEHLIPRNLYMKNEIGIGGVAHQSGTCRFGTDPTTSVLDTNCKAHELDNLYVVDTSFFPSIGAVNPALTAMANALRVGDHLLERLK